MTAPPLADAVFTIMPPSAWEQLLSGADKVAQIRAYLEAMVKYGGPMPPADIVKVQELFAEGLKETEVAMGILAQRAAEAHARAEASRPPAA